MSATATSRTRQGSSEAQTYARAVFEVAFEEWLKGLQHVATTLDRSPGLVQSLADETKGFEARQATLMALTPPATGAGVNGVDYRSMTVAALM